MGGCILPPPDHGDAQRSLLKKELDTPGQPGAGWVQWTKDGVRKIWIARFLMAECRDSKVSVTRNGNGRDAGME